MLTYLSLLVFLSTGVNSLSLEGVSAPSSHPAGEDLIISCDYSYQRAESDQLVLTWYFNGSSIPIYQWVPSLEQGPQVIHQMFKDSLDLTYETAEEDKFKKHSALRIVNPDQRFAGNYKCRLSTFLQEVSHSKDVSIFVPPSSISLAYSHGLISCGVDSVYPQPRIVLSWTSNSTVYSSNTVELTPNDDILDASVTVTIDQEDVAAHDMMTCDVVIAGTDYHKRMEKPILEITDTATTAVELVEDLCDSADCYLTVRDTDNDDINHVDYEALEKTVDSGSDVEILSEPAAIYIESSSNSSFPSYALVWLLAGVTSLH